MRVLFIPDLHCPYDHPKAIEFLKSVRDKYKCDTIICAGDEIDAGTFSVKWPINPDGPSQSRELELAVESLKRFYKEFPEVSVLESNHGLRIFKKALVSGLPRMVLKRYEEILEYPKGWHLVGEKLEVDHVLYIHGDAFNGSNWHTAYNRLKQSVVMGHLHSRAGVAYSRNHKKQFFAVNAGCLIDTHADAFAYARNSLEKPTLGCAVIEDGENALFIRMPEKWVNYR